MPSALTQCLSSTLFVNGIEAAAGKKIRAQINGCDIVPRSYARASR